MTQRWKKPREKRETSPGRNEPTGDITKNEFWPGEKIEGLIYRTMKNNRGKIVCETMKKQRWFWTWNSLHTRNILVMKKQQKDITQDRLRNGQEKEF